MDEYDEIWERFVSDRRLEFGGYMDPSWQAGHTRSASLVVPVDVSPFRERIEPLRDALRPFPFVSLHPDHFLHITLVILGFLVPEPGGKGEISPERLANIEVAARRSLADFPASKMRLANLNAFPGAAFAEAHDGGTLDALREALCEACGLRKPSGPPHLTLAYFQAPDGTRAPDDLISAIARYRDWPVGEADISSVRLTLLDLRSHYPEPDTLAEIELKGAVSGRQSATS